ncbi:MAG: hypothetical protein ACRDV0_08585, partial [Acidimicrobiales bacterium]
VVLCGEGGLLEHVRWVLAPSLDVTTVAGSPEECASSANARGTDLVLSFAPRDDVEGLRLHYWASYTSHSRRGDRLAGEIAGELARSGALSRVDVIGMALPILRETRMTTLHLEHGPLSPDTLYGVATDLARAVNGFFHR